MIKPLWSSQDSRRGYVHDVTSLSTVAVAIFLRPRLSSRASQPSDGSGLTLKSRLTFGPSEISLGERNNEQRKDIENSSPDSRSRPCWLDDLRRERPRHQISSDRATTSAQGR